MDINPIKIDVIVDDHGTTKKSQKVSKSLKEIQRDTKNVKSEFKGFNSLAITLPIMFGMQSVSKAIKSALQPAQDLVGVQQMYQDFLAIKYLPTALKQLDSVINLGKEWENESEYSRKNQGELLLLMDTMADFASFAAQSTMTLQAFGRIFGPVGDAAGLVTAQILNAGVGIKLFTDENFRATASLGDLGQAFAISGSTIVSGFLENLGVLPKDTSKNIEGVEKEFNDFKKWAEENGGDSGKVWVQKLGEKLGETDNVRDKLAIIVGMYEKASDAIKKSNMELGLAPPKEPPKINVPAYNAGMFFTPSKPPPTLEIKPLPLPTTQPSYGTTPYNQFPLQEWLKNVSKTDFLMRPGQPAVSFSPNDTLIGVKNPSALGGGGNVYNVTPNITVNATVSNDMDVRSLASKLNEYWVEDIKRMVR